MAPFPSTGTPNTTSQRRTPGQLSLNSAISEPSLYDREGCNIRRAASDRVPGRALAGCTSASTICVEPYGQAPRCFEVASSPAIIAAKNLPPDGNRRR